MNALAQVVELAGGPIALTRSLNERLERPLTYQAVMKWVRRGRLPRTEWTGETRYAAALSDAVGGQVSVGQLLQRPVDAQTLPGAGSDIGSGAEATHA